MPVTSRGGPTRCRASRAAADLPIRHRGALGPDVARPRRSHARSHETRMPAPPAGRSFGSRCNSNLARTAGDRAPMTRWEATVRPAPRVIEVAIAPWARGPRAEPGPVTRSLGPRAARPAPSDEVSVTRCLTPRTGHLVRADPAPPGGALPVVRNPSPPDPAQSLRT